MSNKAALDDLLADTPTLIELVQVLVAALTERDEARATLARVEALCDETKFRAFGLTVDDIRAALEQP